MNPTITLLGFPDFVYFQQIDWREMTTENTIMLACEFGRLNSGDPSLGGTVFKQESQFSYYSKNSKHIDPWLSETQAPFYSRKNVACKHYWEL